MFTDQQRKILDEVLSAVQTIAGVKAVVLGGSFATGRHTPTSDIDLALYYHSDAPFEISDIQKAVDQLNDTLGAAATPFYHWGPWVNGGAWLVVHGQRVDLLYRNLQQVEEVIQAIYQGKFQTHYEQQPASGFFSYIYLAEVEVCVPLYDPDHRLEQLKSQVRPYPQALKIALKDYLRYMSQFSLPFLETAVKRGDSYLACGCATRISTGLVQFLFALNEQYFLTDKGALAVIEGFSLRPAAFRQRLEAALQSPMESLPILVALVAETDQLAEVLSKVTAETSAEQRLE